MKNRMIIGKVILILIISLTVNHAFSQNKKEQLEVLSYQLDSLNLLLTLERSSSLKTISELSTNKVEIENQMKRLTDELEFKKQELLSCDKKIETIQKSISANSDSIRLLLSVRPKYYIVQDSVTIANGENLGEIVHFERLSVPSEISLEKKINEMIFTLHNLNFNGYECNPNEGFDSYLNKVPPAFKKINDQEINYFASYNILFKDSHNFSLVLHDESFNLIWYNFVILDHASDSGEFFEFGFDRRFLDDPDREH